MGETSMAKIATCLSNIQMCYSKAKVLYHRPLSLPPPPQITAQATTQHPLSTNT